MCLESYDLITDDISRYVCKGQRLLTFRNWIYEEKTSANSLASAGFIYIGEKDKVKCVFCKIIVSHWEKIDIPLDEHLKYSPLCFFANLKNVKSKCYAKQNVHLAKEESYWFSAIVKILVLLFVVYLAISV